jgi:cyclase
VRLLQLLILVIWVSLVWSQSRARIPTVLSKISPNLHLITGNGGNVAALLTSEGVVVVDDMYVADGPEIIEKLRSITDKPTRYIINTHHHADHIGSNVLFRSQNAELIMHSNARVNTMKRANAGGYTSPPGIPQLVFNDEMQIFLGGQETKIKYLGRGHTDGDAVVLFPRERVVHTGDLFVTDGEIYIDMAFGGTITEWDKSLRNLLAYDFDTVIPGHGPIAKKADLVKWIDSIGAIRNRMADACKSGNAQDAVNRFNLGGLDVKPIYLVRAFPDACKELVH